MRGAAERTGDVSVQLNFSATCRFSCAVGWCSGRSLTRASCASPRWMHELDGALRKRTAGSGRLSDKIPGPIDERRRIQAG